MSDLLVADYGRWLAEWGITAPPRSISTLLLLRDEKVLSVTAIAERLRFTHPLIISLLAELEKRGLTSVTRDASDGRRRLIALTAKGRREASRVEAATEVMGRAYEGLFRDSGVDLLHALSQVETACRGSSFYDRLHSAASRNGSAHQSSGQT
jgi:DNA-binding MarR family transcriptional regulator